MLHFLKWHTRYICNSTVCCCDSFFVLIIRFSNSVKSGLHWYLSFGCQLSGNASQENSTEHGRFMWCYLFWASCMRYGVNPCVFHSTHHHLLVYLCPACRPPAVLLCTEPPDRTMLIQAWQQINKLCSLSISVGGYKKCLLSPVLEHERHQHVSGVGVV